MGNDDITRAYDPDDMKISIHVPAWGTTKDGQSISSDEEFQSTFPRGERPPLPPDEDGVEDISIHVPAWGTTPLD